MRNRWMVVALGVGMLVLEVQAKSKKNDVLPAYVLRAQTVAVVIEPGAGEPVKNPTANRDAVDAVERALTKWGRFRVVMDVQNADLVIAIRTGHASGPTIMRSPADDRPVILQPGDGNIRIGGKRGNPGDPTQSGTRPGMGSEVGPSEDLFELYRGGVDDPLDAPAVWRYMAKDALKAPQVRAVERLRDKIFESENQAQKP